VGADRLAELSGQLSSAAADVAGGPSGRTLWKGLQVSGCEAIDCGYLSRCHPRSER
jgi:hypothetical protein